MDNGEEILDEKSSSRTVKRKSRLSRVSSKSKRAVSIRSAQKNKSQRSQSEPLPLTEESNENTMASEIQLSTELPTSSENYTATNKPVKRKLVFPGLDNLTKTCSSSETDEEYENIMQHKLCIEPDLDSTFDFCNVIKGNRIVQLGYLLNWAIRIQYNHAKSCTGGLLYPSREITRGLGLISHIEFKCNACDIEIVKATEDPNFKQSVINTGAVWGTLATGGTFGHLEELLNCMNVPCLNKYTYSIKEKSLQKLWHEELATEMAKAGKEEYDEAIRKGDIDKDGVPFITVYVDGGWSKRSYGHNYNAASGVAVIIGKYTKKVLFMGVRNKYCTICARAANKDEEPKNHVCFRNWSGSSSAMEQDIIAQGFCFSEEQHGLRYKKFIADGDSSVFCAIRKKCSYGESVTKIECANHAIKNHGKKLHNLKKDKALSDVARKQLTVKIIDDLQSIAQSSIYNCSFEENPLESLREDFQIGLNHTFGDHSKCKPYFGCENEDTSNSNIEAIKKSGLYHHIDEAIENLLKKSHMLIDNETNNRAELFMSILARFNCGKRLNLSGRGSFDMRCDLTALRYNLGPEWHVNSYKRELGMSPGKYFQSYIDRSVRSRTLSAMKSQNSSRSVTKLPAVEKNMDYGVYAEQVEPTPEEIEISKKRTMEKLRVTEEQRNDIAMSTINQFENGRYRAEKKNRLTASKFGAVMARRNTTRCHGLVKEILYPSEFQSESTSFGKRYEAVALTILAEKLDIEKVTKAGLYIDTNNCFLGASPDGLVGNTHCVEVKCIPKLIKKNLTLRHGTEKKLTCLKINEHGLMELNRDHAYYYQVQGQMNITGREKCYFVVYVTDDDTFIEEIPIDRKLWNDVLLPKLTIFYNDCILEEIARRRYLRNMKCYDPPWIELAISEKSEKKSQKSSTKKQKL